MGFSLSIVKMCCLLLLLFITITALVSAEPCKDIVEYYNPLYKRCKSCPSCIKGTGIDLTQKIKRTNLGMTMCYSCEDCPSGKYQDESHVIRSCQQCDICSNRISIRNCSSSSNSICGVCWLGYQIQYKNGTGICEKIEIKESDCTPFRTGIGIGIAIGIGIGIIMILLLVILFRRELLDLIRSRCGDNQHIKALVNQNNHNGNDKALVNQNNHNGNDKDLVEKKLKVYLSDQQTDEDVNETSDLLLQKRPENDQNGIKEENEDMYELKDEFMDDGKLSKVISDWKRLARLLKLTETDIIDIENEEKGTWNRTYRTLQKFKMKFPNDSKSLIKALFSMQEFGMLKKKNIP